jgi:hypothetical protein
MRNQLKNSYLFIFVVTLVYSVVFVASEHLQGALWDDEIGFWDTSLEFSHQLLPSLSQIQDYNQFNTPLPFIVFGILEYLFRLGPFAARLLSFFSSLGIAFLIGWPTDKSSIRSIFSLLGLFLFPFFLLLSGRLYTDIIAAFLGLIGTVLYLQNRHFVSGISFALAIACRQFMLAFPAAIATHELVRSIYCRKWPSLSFFVPAGAALTILIWVAFFGDLAPATAIANRSVPENQQSLFALSVNNGLYSLSTLGWAYVIPEFLLLNRQFKFSKAALIKLILIAVVMIPLFLSFPPLQTSLSVFTRVTDKLPYEWLSLSLFMILGILTCWRFSRIDLAFWMILFNSGIMMKAVAWDKYALPIIVIFWYFQARNIDSRDDFLSLRCRSTDIPQVARN